MSFCSSKTRIILIGIRVDDINMSGKKQNIAPMWKKLMKNVDIEEPTSFLDHVYLGCTQRECKPSDRVTDQYREMFESRFSVGATQKLPGWEKHCTKRVAWSVDMESRVKKCVERYCELANKEAEQLYKVSNSMAGRPSLQKGRTGNGRRIVTECARTLS